MEQVPRNAAPTVVSPRRLTMSLFGSPDEDPLLQDEPGVSPAEEDENEAGPAGASDMLFSTEGGVDDPSIFEGDTAEFVFRTDGQLSSGQLASLNALLRGISRTGLLALLSKLSQLYTVLQNGWQLEGIERRNDPSLSFAFELKRLDSGGEDEKA